MKNYSVGIDLGSRTIKIVFLENESKTISYSNVVSTGIVPADTAKNLFEKGKKKLKIKPNQIEKIFSTGYGRKILDLSDKAVSEISCHAKGVHFFFPDVKTIIDIGGQDSKGILINNQGRVVDFVMNDKCAAGTGRFLEKTALILETSVDKLSDLALKADKKLSINSVCVVFAESEIIGLIAKGESPGNIVQSVHSSIAKRTKNLIAPLNWQKPIVFTGGVANNTAMIKALEKYFDTEIEVVENPSITGAVGAALFALEHA